MKYNVKERIIQTIHEFRIFIFYIFGMAMASFSLCLKRIICCIARLNSMTSYTLTYVYEMHIVFYFFVYYVGKYAYSSMHESITKILIHPQNDC